MTFSSIQSLLNRRGQFHIEPGLERMKCFMASLGNPQDAFPTVHIAGTNGKGSVSAMLESVLRGAGYRTGLYISPHLVDVRERVQLDRSPISTADFVRYGSILLKAEKKTKIQLTYFEWTTALAFLVFEKKKVDIGIIETGMGGRWDATNILRKPEVCVITSISLDHQQWLGKNIKAIAAEKAGIVKSNVPVVIGANGEAARVIGSAARERKASTYLYGRSFSSHSGNADWKQFRQTFTVRTSDNRSARVSIPLMGNHQQRNAAAVLQTLNVLREKKWTIPSRCLHEGLLSVSWPGRMQPMQWRGRNFLVDGAHNIGGVQALVKTVRRSPFGKRPVTWIFGVYRDKDYAEMIRVVASFADRMVLTRVPNERALPLPELRRICQRHWSRERIHVTSGPFQAMKRSIEITRPGEWIIASGSLRLIGMILHEMDSRN